MTEEVQDVNPTEQSAVEPGVQKEESPTSELAEPTAEQGVQQEEQVEEPESQEQQVPYTRFKEVLDERNQMTEIVKNLANRQQTGETKKQVEDDPYAGMTAEEAHFYRNLDGRMQKIVQKEAAKIAEPFAQQSQAMAKQLAALQTERIFEANKDLLPGSKEEKDVAELMKLGVPKDKAVWAVLGPQRAQSAQKQSKVVKQQKTQQKIQANVETQTVAPDSGLLPQEKLSFREKADKIFREGGL